MDNEKWRPVVGYEGFYEVSDCGNMRSLDRYAGSRVGNGKFINGQNLNKPIDNKSGYRYVSLNKKGKGRSTRIHRIVALAFIPNPDKLPQVNHIDGDKSNNCVSNLEWCNNRENITHARILVGTASRCYGTYYSKKDKKWVAAIGVGFKTIRIGGFNRQQDANKAVKKYLIDHKIHNRYAK